MVQDLLILPVWLCFVAVSALLLGDTHDAPRSQWVAKPLAALAVVLAALEWSALGSDYGRWILLGLTLSALGNVLLIPKGRSGWFVAAIGVFLLGQVAYVVAFLGLPLERSAAWVAGAVVAMVAGLLLWWLLPRMGARPRLPVVAYVLVSLVMVTTAAAASYAGAPWTPFAGTVGFAASGVAVARDRFVAPGFVNRSWGLPLYFASQLTIAYSVSMVGL